MNKSLLRCRRWCRSRRDLCGLLSLRSRVALERARRRKFTELVSDHVLSHIDRNVTLAVVHAERQTDHVRRNRRTSRPGLNHLRTLTAGPNALNHLANALIDPGTFFY